MGGASIFPWRATRTWVFSQAPNSPFHVRLEGNLNIRLRLQRVSFPIFLRVRRYQLRVAIEKNRNRGGPSMRSCSRRNLVLPATGERGHMNGETGGERFAGRHLRHRGIPRAECLRVPSGKSTPHFFFMTAVPGTAWFFRHKQRFRAEFLGHATLLSPLRGVPSFPLPVGHGNGSFPSKFPAYPDQMISHRHIGLLPFSLNACVFRASFR